MDRTHSQTTTPTDGDATRGPQLLEERSVAGILVHFIAIPTGVVGAGLVYLLASNEFTRRNARNALDWHLTVLGLTAAAFGSLVIYTEGTGQGLTDIVVLPSSVSTAAGIAVPVLLALWVGVLFLTFAVGLAAMGKAIFGSAWRYPLSPRLVDRYGSFVAVDNNWPLVIAAYVVSFPAVIWGVFFGFENEAVFFLSTFGLLGLLMVLTPLTMGAMYLHGDRDRSLDADWQPPVVAYLGVPAGIGLVGYGGFRMLTDSVYPLGDGMYAFLAAFWVSAAVYLTRWWTTASE